MHTDKSKGPICPAYLRFIESVSINIYVEKFEIFGMKVILFVVCSPIEMVFPIRAHQWYPWLNSSRIIPNWGEGKPRTASSKLHSVLSTKSCALPAIKYSDSTWRFINKKSAKVAFVYFVESERSGFGDWLTNSSDFSIRISPVISPSDVRLTYSYLGKLAKSTFVRM